MAYDEMLASRIREGLFNLNADFSEKKMFSGICFMVDDKMCCGTHIDKSNGESLLLCRVSEEVAGASMELPHVLPMNFTGKPMKGYIYIAEAGIESQKELAKWLQLCLEFNPMAKSAKKKQP